MPKNGVLIFIALIEHKSSVDYNVSMQILRYMVYIWDDYERREEKRVPDISKLKGFKYPPVFRLCITMVKVAGLQTRR